MTSTRIGGAVRLMHGGLGAQPHTVAATTPTGHTCTSRAGPAPYRSTSGNGHRGAA